MNIKHGLIILSSLTMFSACLMANDKIKSFEKNKQIVMAKAFGYNEASSIKGDKNTKKNSF